ncbi:hypothetical protein ACFS7Z_11325 [Pontibacter toksunensis]|uniref:Uncharacterized protein n=1 Tax=Pontibacter toksunensis TaxID=1332631 RepID=A0ABW6BUJ2_9BACT
MKARFLSFAIALLVLFNFTDAFAQNPNLRSPLTSSVTNDQQLQVCYDISGLGNVESVLIIVNYDLTVNTFCYNRGQKSGPVPGLTQHYEDQSFTQAVPVRNGRARGCITTEENIQAGSCPPGMARSETSVSYSNITLSIYDETFAVPDAN